MNTNNEHINRLSEKLDELQKKQNSFSFEIDELRNEINKLKQATGNKQAETSPPQQNIAATTIVAPKKDIEVKPSPPPQTFKPPRKSNLEKFIGENLISKIGIIITIIGVSIGVKYSIEHQLISPATRIILGYLMSIGLTVVGLKLRNKYENYSAVLVSGSMAIMYFITFAAYNYYALMPQVAAFLLMVVITVLTVVAAIKYNNQIIAHIGLVGAYAIPFLLSDGSGKVHILFTYMAIINIGILSIAFKKYWKPLLYFSFGLTWLIYISWAFLQYSVYTQFGIALLFASIFFTIFYLSFLAYKVVRNEIFGKADVALILVNSFIFYAVGYSLINEHENGDSYLGLYTLCNAIIHLIVSLFVYKRKGADKNLFYLLAGLSLLFITISIPVQLDGHWVTLGWACQAVLLFSIGRTRAIGMYESYAYPIMSLVFFSLIHDWSIDYTNYPVRTNAEMFTLILNTHFLNSALVIVAYSIINILNYKYKPSESLTKNKDLIQFVNTAIPGVLITVVYVSFLLEINNYWDQLFRASAYAHEIKGLIRDYSLKSFSSVWLINYSLAFVALLSFLNIRKIKNELLGTVSFIISIILVFIFLTVGLYALSELREDYLQQYLTEQYTRSSFYVYIRYISYVFAGLLLLAMYRHLKSRFMQKSLVKVLPLYELILALSILWIASSELLNIMDIFNKQRSYKLALSILWGIYSMLVTSYGIWKKKKHLRVGAIVLFGVTLLKLFFYDIAHLDTISKTIVFVSLGVLLLIISFLYNKYKHIIAEEDADQNDESVK